MSDTLVTAIGIISGTSMDGIDVAMVETDGHRVRPASEGRTYPYPEALRRELQSLIAAPERARTDALADLEGRVTDAHATAVTSFLRDFGIDPGRVGLVGM